LEIKTDYQAVTRRGEKCHLSRISECHWAPGWIGVAYLKPDPKASGREARRQFIAAGGDSFKENPPGPPSATYTTPGDGGPGESPLLQGGVEVAGELTVRSD
jgi:hypothetical protein